MDSSRGGVVRRRSRRTIVGGLLAASVCLAGLAGLSGTGSAQAAAARHGADPAVGVGSVLSSPAGLLASGPRSNGTAVLPDGRFLTPVGRSVGTQLEPQSGVLSHDGRRLYLSSEGVDDAPPNSRNHDLTRHARFFSVVDTATLAITTVEDDALHSGLAESPDGRTLYVDEGQTDSLGVFGRTPSADGGVGTFRKVADYPLNPASPKDYPWGLALSSDGSKAYISGFSGDSLTVVDTARGTVLSRVSTGSYPYAVAVSRDGRRAYVSNMGLYNADAALGISSPVAPPPATYGGYNSTNSASVWTYDLTSATPRVVAATKIGKDLNGADVVGGSSPSGLALSPDGRTLAVTASSDDLIELLDTTSTTPSLAVPSVNAPAVPAHPARVVDMQAVPGTPRLASPTGAQPDAPAWSPDGKVLFVGEGERNDVAVIDPARVEPSSSAALSEPTAPGVGYAPGPNRAAVTGRIPTAWYPSALQVSADSSHLFVVSMKGLGSGPNTGVGALPTTATPDPPAAAYIPNTIHGRVTDIALSSACAALPRLTAASDADNGLVQPSKTAGSNGNGYVVPTSYGQPASAKIKHVFLIIKENRSYDQVFGDQPGTESDGRYASYGRFDTPNAHALADQFSLSDNYDATTETSTQGHFAIDTGQVDEFVDKLTPSQYANKLPYGAFDTLPENLPEGGFIWNNAARHGVHTTVFGEGTFVVGASPALLGKSPSQLPSGQLIPGVQQDGYTTYYAPYPSQVNPVGSAGPAKGPLETALPYNDEGRATAFASAVTAGKVVSQLNVMILFDDHTSGDIAGAQTPERQIAENDHGLGRVMSTISHSKYWKDSAVFVTEDDTQGGQDHVDAYRTLALVASPYAAPGRVSHVHTSFSSMTKTINLLLGLPPTSLQEMTSTTMADSFITSGQPRVAPFQTRPNNTQPDTNASVATASNPLLKAAAKLALHVPAGIDKGGELLPADIALEHAGELAAHDPNVRPTSNVVHHTLPTGSPTPLVLPPAQHGTASPTAGCLSVQPTPHRAGATTGAGTVRTDATTSQGGTGVAAGPVRAALATVLAASPAFISWRRVSATNPTLPLALGTAVLILSAAIVIRRRTLARRSSDRSAVRVDARRVRLTSSERDR